MAGDRGRKSNFVYGSAKAGLSAYLEGWRGRLEGTGVSVALIKPGMVDTPMTADFEKGPLFASAPTVGAGVYKALTTKRSSEYYLPGLWRWIMLIIKWIPNRIMANYRFSRSNVNLSNDSRSLNLGVLSESGCGLTKLVQLGRLDSG